MRARHPAKSPPPKIVVPKERRASTLPVGLAPETRSRTPPCTIKTAKVVRQPMQNHHKNDRMSPHHPMSEKMARPFVRQPFRTLAEPYQGVKQTAYLPLRSSLLKHEPLTPPRGRGESGSFYHDARRPTRSPLHYLPSPVPALPHCRPRHDNWPRQRDRTWFDNSAEGI